MLFNESQLSNFLHSKHDDSWYFQKRIVCEKSNVN